MIIQCKNYKNKRPECKKTVSIGDCRVLMWVLGTKTSCSTYSNRYSPSGQVLPASGIQCKSQLSRLCNGEGCKTRACRHRQSVTHCSRCGRGRGAGERDHFLDSQAELEAVQGVADPDLPLDFRVRQSRHDGPTLHVGTAGCHVPSWHPEPQLQDRGNGEKLNGTNLKIQNKYIYISIYISLINRTTVLTVGVSPSLQRTDG